MCTLILMFRAREDVPLVVAANRDEFFHRPATTPRVISAPEDAARITAGRDLERGGTWMGVEHGGLFVGLTNQRTGQSSDTTLRSRGEVVLTALSLRSPDRVCAYLSNLDAREFNPFNLAFGTADSLHVAYARSHERRMEIHALAPGTYVLPNDVVDSPTFPKVARARTLLDPQAATMPLPDLRTALTRVLSDHQRVESAPVDDAHNTALLPAPLLRELSALCVHTPLYGTRSASLIGLRPGGVAFYHFADGPPCRTPFAPVPD
jgi:uncharacterized protein with NRDE domain